MEQLEEKQPFDVIVIGAGAAGMMAAGTAARSGRRVLLIEKMEKSGRKVRITGKGRCNVTNARPAEEFADQVRTNAEFFKVAFSEFNNRAAIKFFERAGVKLDIERGDRVFPQSGKAWDIANALLEFCVENGVKIIYNTRVTEILTLGDRVFGVKYINIPMRRLWITVPPLAPAARTVSITSPLKPRFTIAATSEYFVSDILLSSFPLMPGTSFSVPCVRIRKIRLVAPFSGIVKAMPLFAA